MKQDCSFDFYVLVSLTSCLCHTPAIVALSDCTIKFRVLTFTLTQSKLYVFPPLFKAEAFFFYSTMNPVVTVGTSVVYPL